MNCLLICLVAIMLTRHIDYTRLYAPGQVYGAWTGLAISVVNFSLLSPLVHHLLLLCPVLIEQL